MGGTKPIDENRKIGGYDIIKTVLHAFVYALLCNNINIKELDYDISSAMLKCLKQIGFLVHDGKPLYEDQYGTHVESIGLKCSLGTTLTSMK